MDKQDSPGKYVVTNNCESVDINNVVVYCASSPHIDDIYFEVARELGRLLAENKIGVVTGAGKQGLMGAVNDSVIESEGRVKGVIPQFMVDLGWFHPGLTELVITKDMHERKELMAQSADAAIALPGGLGTLEELAEILTWKQLGIFNKPVIILNTNGFYDPLLNMFEQMIDRNFMHDSYRNMWHVADSPEKVISSLQNNVVWSSSISKYDKKEL